MSWLESFVLAVVQGLTEFLPVSSSGHLEIGQALLGTSGEENLTFAIVVHTATVLSTLVVFRKEIGKLLCGIFSTWAWNDEKDYVAKILLSMLPVFVVGMFFKDEVEAFFGNGLLWVGICLLITAVLLAVSEYVSRRRTTSGHEVTFRDAILIGCAQAVAVLPGLSRSGATIATGLLCGVKKESVAQFSFLMVLIPILGEAFLDGLKALKSPDTVTVLPFSSLLIGFVVAFLTGCFACKFMVNVVRKQKMIYFAVYCLLVGLLAVLWSVVA